MPLQGLVPPQHFDRAEFAAHGANFLAFMCLSAFVDRGRVKGGFGHAFPVQRLACGVHVGFALYRSWAAESDLAHMGGHAGSHDASTNVLFRRKRKVFSRGKVAEKIHTGFDAKSAANGSGNMVVARALSQHRGPST